MLELAVGRRENLWLVGTERREIYNGRKQVDKNARTRTKTIRHWVVVSCLHNNNNNNNTSSGYQCSGRGCGRCGECNKTLDRSQAAATSHEVWTLNKVEVEDQIPSVAPALRHSSCDDNRRERGLQWCTAMGQHSVLQLSSDKMTAEVQKCQCLQLWSCLASGSGKVVWCLLIKASSQCP